MCLSPDSAPKAYAVFSHGYTAHHIQLLSWGERLAQLGMATVVFNLPGHLLSDSCQVGHFPDFEREAHTLFQVGHNWLLERFKTQVPLVIGGHSLGSLLSLKAGQEQLFGDTQRIFICVGFGAPKEEGHLFQSKLYKKTLQLREQLVSPALGSTTMFNWLREQKNGLKISGERIHLITGADDVVVGEGGLQKISDQLESLGNTVSMFEPKTLPHHHPEMAHVHIASFLKNEWENL